MITRWPSLKMHLQKGPILKNFVPQSFLMYGIYGQIMYIFLRSIFIYATGTCTAKETECFTLRKRKPMCLRCLSKRLHVLVLQPRVPKISKIVLLYILA